MKIDRIFCINLPSRSDRWRDCLGEFEKLNISESEVVKFDAVPDKVGTVGCTKSHMEIVKVIKREGYKNVLILEDDFLVINPIDLRELETIDIRDFGLFYLGANLGDDPQIVNDRILKVKGYTGTTHCYIMNDSVHDFILSHKWPWENKPLFKPTSDCKVKEIDSFYSKSVIPNFNCYHYYPMIATQRDGFSDSDKRQTTFGSLMVKNFESRVARSRKNLEQNK